MSKYIYLIGNLEKRIKYEQTNPSGVRISISNRYRSTLLDLNKMEFLPRFITFIMATICKETTKEQLMELSIEIAPPKVWFKKFYSDLKNVFGFLLDNIQISEEDAKLIIELGIAKVFFYKDYIEITTILNEEVIEHGIEDIEG